MKPHTQEAQAPSLSATTSNYNDSFLSFQAKTDEEIWMALNKGNELAFNYLYRTLVAPMYRYGCQISKDKGLVKDCIQNIFIQLRKKRGTLSEVHNCKAYLFSCLKHEIFRRMKELRGEHLEMMTQEDGFPICLSHEAILIQKEQECEKVKKIQEALDQLTGRQRQALLLLYTEGMSYQEIARVMEFSEVKSARKLVYRALSSLRQILKY
ncbi:RNA polymerase sigma factor [Cyclobacterium jeungdonense]|uniref:RNA polymerase sigma factor n=1 Tax=Cyclobacterium jeungdonense TaxID=708087 RepID=A0ABT8CDP9_9BACT|nr:RNA polymerase sigma factor [Cyclobacterium jeungdonense]MDN3690527.1 RNA polymerase sigma factor [Cyclobacterium jeungdonense]